MIPLLPIVNKSTNKVTRKIVAKVTAAFTVVELIVVVGIFGIIMSVALANQQELNSSLLITNLAYEIGLAVRETQAYGIGVRAQPGVVDAKNFQGAFGMHINMGGGNSTDTIIIFKDLDNDGRYTENSIPSELFSIYKFQNQRGNKILALCVADGDYLCQREDLNKSVDELNIVFKRPNPEASFRVIPQNSSEVVTRVGTAYIVINTQAGKNCRAIVVETTGQVRVESAKSNRPACHDSL